MYPIQRDKPSQFESERLIIRAYQPGDGQWFYPVCLRNQGHLKQFEGHNPVHGIHSVEDAEKLVHGFIVDWNCGRHYFMAALEKSTLAFAGQIYIGVVDWDMPEFEVGYFVDVDHEGKGYISEAVRATLGILFKELHALRVSLDCDDTNVRSQHVAERCGFLKEGHIRQNKRREGGVPTGTFIYGMLREEFDFA